MRVTIAALGLALLATGANVQAADVQKVIRVAYQIAETSYDNAFASDEVSQSVGERIIEPMLDYDYLARPLKLTPRTLSKLPEITDNGKTITATLQKGIFFADDPAFKGKKRELIAADYAYALKRLMDPKIKSPWHFLVEGKIVGGNAAREAAQKSGQFDYDAPLEGLQVVDRYTLRIKLTDTDYNFLYILAMPSTGASAREVVDFYGPQIGSHPVGTGPFMLGEYKRASKTVLIANPNFRAMKWDFKSDAPEDQATIKAMTGKKVPSVERVEIYTVEEGQARWLAFLGGEHEYLTNIPPQVSANAKDGDKLKEEYAARGMRLRLRETPNLYYFLFNMEHPVMGGMSKDRIALRRAIQYAFPLDDYIRVVAVGDARALSGVIPPNVTGFDPKRPRAHRHDPELANALLDRFGYKDRDGDGFREQPDGTPLVIEYVSGTSSLSRQIEELWLKSLKQIGLKISIENQKVPDRRKAAREGKAKMMPEAWNADYPDAENFFQLLYGRNANAGGENYARFRLKEFDERYEKMRVMANGPERMKLIAEMQDLIAVYTPWIVPYQEIFYTLENPWLVGFRKNPISHDQWEYMDIDVSKLPKR